MYYTDFLATIDSFFATRETAVDVINCKGGRTALDASKWLTFADMEKAAEDFNEFVGTDFLHVGLTLERAGQRTPEVYSSWEFYPADAAEDGTIYGDQDNNNIHVVPFDRIDDEQEFLAEGAEDMAAPAAAAYLANLTAEFAKIRAQISEDDVLVYDTDVIPGMWEICKRFPMWWENDTETFSYRLVLAGGEYDDADYNFAAYMDEQITEAVEGGAVFTSNADPAHTGDYPEEIEEILKAVDEEGCREIFPVGADAEEYAIALAQLDFPAEARPRIFRAGIFTFAPDVWR